MEEAVEVLDINALYAQIRRSPNFLEQIDRKPFVDSPLHAAARKGNIDLVIELTRLKPSFARKLNPDGFSPMHIALSFQVISRQPPWHGSEKPQYCNKRIFNWKDKDGNTLLHIATSRNQLEVVRFLLDRKVDVNARNLDDRTPLDLLLYQTEPRNEEIDNMLRNAEARLPTLLPTFDTYTHLRTDQRLNLAALVGNVDAIYDLILEDVHVLDRIDQVPFIDTPLHIAASAGHVQFALEIMRLKPSFARKQNQYGFSPLHLALKYQQTEIVLRILDVDRNLICIQGRDGITSLHYAAEKGMVDLLSEFLVTCPESILVLTNRRETAFHIAAKNNQLEALKVMLGWLRHFNKDEILNWTDDEGNTLLHILISRNHGIEIVRLIINRVQRNVKNSAGLTVRDILKIQTRGQQTVDQEVEDLFGNATVGEPSLSCATIADSLKKKLSVSQKLVLALYRRGLLVTEESKNAVLVVAVLIATATYDAALNYKDVAKTLGLNEVTATNSSISGAENNDLWTDSLYAYISFRIFLYTNSVAFWASMVHIYYRLPSGSATLIWPILVCYFFLTAELAVFIVGGLLAFLLVVLPLTPGIALLYYGGLKLKVSSIKFSTKVLGHIFKHYRSFHNEMIESDPIRRESTLFS